jgi:hypothetical protein
MITKPAISYVEHQFREIHETGDYIDPTANL